MNIVSFSKLLWMHPALQVFFVIRLHTVQAANELGPIVDPDPLMNNDLMDGRDAFLTLARDKHYEFSSLRRTKFSSIGMLYELHTQSRGDSFVYTCNACRANVETRYHCTRCDVSSVYKKLHIYSIFLPFFFTDHLTESIVGRHKGSSCISDMFPRPSIL